MTTRTIPVRGGRIVIRAFRGVVRITHERPHWSLPDLWVQVGESESVTSVEQVQSYKPRRARLAVLAAWTEAVALAAMVERDRARHAQWGEA